MLDVTDNFNVWIMLTHWLDNTALPKCNRQSLLILFFFIQCWPMITLAVLTILG